MKKIIALIFLTFPSVCFAQAKVLAPVENQTSMAIGGRAPNGDAVPFNVDASGNFLSVDAFGDINATTITVTGNGATQRTQGTTLTVRSCTFQAVKANVGVVYARGSTVTNVSGTNEGFPLFPGDGLGPVTMSNLNQIYFAADTANDKIAVFCN